MSAKKTQPETDKVVDFLERLHGHSKLIIEDADGTEYTLRYPRAVVKQMESNGMTADVVAEMASEATSLTTIERLIDEFVYPAFKSDQPKVNKDTVREIYRSIADKGEFLGLLIGLYTAPVRALTTDPTETRAVFRLA
ncbi:DUF5055 domain-containing protein [Collinsella sp. AGMB00827]|uniref:DUF5055 domain-containing protein n=1 Tax=Collinsella ureilytica TaxID=2869515 RepID=A0ABS7MMU1_9ACTN|nr:DUF5055 domain-containing protein [Collinsella urealyticum]MBY4798353.1 DUF5055 domain-containing protein [Collinsella urealyticum]